jgi:hypothetical protein
MSEIKISELTEIFSTPADAVVPIVTGGNTFKSQKANLGFARLFVSATAPTGTRTTGDIWVDTSGSQPVFKTWDGSQWVTQAFASTLLPGSIPIADLEDIDSQRILGRVSAATGEVEVLTPTQARTVLELVAVATSGSASDLSTGTLNDARLSGAVTASLALADTAVQPGDLAPVATSGDYNDLSNLPVLRTEGVIWVSKGSNATDTRTGLNVYDVFRPFATVGAAETAAGLGDVIRVLPGDYSAETALAGKDGVTYQGMHGAILPAFNVTTAITIKGSGLCQFIICDGGTIDMPDMDTVAGVFSENATVIVRNAGTFITAEMGGIVVAQDAGTYINCLGTITILNANQSYDGTEQSPIQLSNSGTLTIENSRIESTELNGEVIDIANNWSGSLKMFNSRMKSTNVGTDGATIGIKYGTGVTGTVQLDGVLIETAQNGIGVAKSIDAPSAQNVLVGSPLKVTQDVDADVNLLTGDLLINTAYKA